MSLVSLTSLAINRDLAAPGQPIKSGRPAGAAGVGPVQPTPMQPATTGAPAAGSVAGFAELLVAQIPSEALLAYTTLLALFSVGGASYNSGRWILYGSAIFACAGTVVAGYIARRNYGFDDVTHAKPTGAEPSPGDQGISSTASKSVRRATHLPYLPTSTAALSMAVYGLTVPGSPLQFDLSGPGFAIVSGCLAVAGGVMMAALAPFLGKGNAAVPAKA